MVRLEEGKKSLFSLMGSFKLTVLSISLLKLLVLGLTYIFKCPDAGSNLLGTIYYLGKRVVLVTNYIFETCTYTLQTT